jgi:hypothetical protein
MKLHWAQGGIAATEPREPLEALDATGVPVDSLFTNLESGVSLDTQAG